MKQKNPKYLNDNDPWILAEDIPDIDFQFAQIWLSSFANDLSRSCGKNYKKIVCVFNGLNLKFYYGDKDSDDFANHLLNKIVKTPAFGNKINKNIRIFSDKLKKNSEEITGKALVKMSNGELISFYNKLDKLHTELYIWGWLPNAADMFHVNFTNYLKNSLAKKLPEEELNKALVLLSNSEEKSVFNLEHESFLKIISLKQNGKSQKEIDKAISKHLKRYFHLKHLWIGKDGVYDYDYYVSEIKKFIKSKENAGKLLKKENTIFKDALREKNALIKKLKLTKKEIEIFDVYAEFAVTKAYRRDAQLFWAYKMDFVFQELSRRLNLSIIETRFMFPNEIADSLRNGVKKKLREEIKKRTKHCVYYVEKGIDKMLYNKEAKEFEKKLETKQDNDIKEFSGQTACLGEAKGYVRVINSVTEIKKMEKGDILVSIATNPDIVPAMKKAAAIITEQGGITSHAAIVSRELNIPCVIGTKIATKVLKDGDLVEVDANKGVIKILN